MTGKIIYDGIILDNNGNRYTYTQEEILNTQDFGIGAVVDFSVDENGMAKAIVITQKANNGFKNWLFDTNPNAIKTKLLIGFWIWLICYIVDVSILIMTKMTHYETIISDYVGDTTSIISSCASLWLLFPAIALSRASGNKTIIPAFVALIILDSFGTIDSIFGITEVLSIYIVAAVLYLISYGFYYIALLHITGRKEFVFAFVCYIICIIYIIAALLDSDKIIDVLTLPGLISIIGSSIYEILGASKISKIYKKGETHKENPSIIEEKTQEELQKKVSQMGSIMLWGIWVIVGAILSFGRHLHKYKDKILLSSKDFKDKILSSDFSDFWHDPGLLSLVAISVIALSILLFILVKFTLLIIKLNRSTESKVLLKSFVAIPIVFILTAICSYSVFNFDPNLTLKDYLTAVIFTALYISLVPYCFGIIELSHITKKKAFIVGLVFSLVSFFCVLAFAYLIISDIEKLDSVLMIGFGIAVIIAAFIASVVSYISFLIGFKLVKKIYKSQAF